MGCGDDECSRYDIDGVYRASLHEITGTCGDIEELIVYFDGGSSEPPVGCTMEYEKYTDNDCKFEGVATCEDLANNLRTREVMTGKQEPGGDTITATLTIVELDEAGHGRAEVDYANQDGEQVLSAWFSGLLPIEAEKEVLRQMLAEGDPTNKLR